MNIEAVAEDRQKKAYSKDVLSVLYEYIRKRAYSCGRGQKLEFVAKSEAQV